MKASASLATLALIVLSSIPASAQVAHGGRPRAASETLTTPIAFLSAPAPDVARYMAQDDERNNWPLRYGAIVPLEAGIANGTWTTLSDGTRVWRLRIASPGAWSLALEFERFLLPSGAKLFVYDEGLENVFGAYTDENRDADGGFVFQPFPGDELILELSVPKDAREPVLAIKDLIYDYRNVLLLMAGTSTLPSAPSMATSCLIDVNCPQGANWEKQKRATIQTFSHGVACSGALLNDTSSDGTGFVLTADHCGQTSHTIFVFLNQLPGCGTGAAVTNMTVSGCTVLASDSNLDCRFLSLLAPIPHAYNPYFAGWTRTTQDATFAFEMGHPSGGPKKIAIAGTGTTTVAPYWDTMWTQGLLMTGCSGGPLFDQDGLVRGPGCCVNNFNCGQQMTYFGQFYLFWPAISAWLDPLGLNPMMLDGFDPFLVPATVASYCFGDGSGASCPCGNVSAVGNMEGCLSSLGTGGKLVGTGNTSVTTDTFTLLGTRMPSSGALYFQGTVQTAAGAGAAFGDGLRCAGGAVVRLGTKLNAAGASQYPDAGEPSISVVGGNVAGNVRNYQCWYRNAAPYCQAETYNLTNGVQATWEP